jgi:hypothetical protein
MSILSRDFTNGKIASRYLKTELWISTKGDRYI